MRRRLAVAAATVGLLLLLMPPALAAADPAVTVFATGFENPRGLTFGPDGSPYVAEGGTGGGTTTTPAQCAQVPAPVGPYSGGFTARISKVSPAGVRSTVVDGLPSSQTSAASGSLVSGVSDVKFIGGTLYGLEAAAGCSHGLAGTVNSVFRVNTDGTVTPIADLSAFVMATLSLIPTPMTSSQTGPGTAWSRSEGPCMRSSRTTARSIGSARTARSRGSSTSRRARATSCRPRSAT